MESLLRLWLRGFARRLRGFARSEGACWLAHCDRIRGRQPPTTPSPQQICWGWTPVAASCSLAKRLRTTWSRGYRESLPTRFRDGGGVDFPVAARPGALRPSERLRVRRPRFRTICENYVELRSRSAKRPPHALSRKWGKKCWCGTTRGRRSWDAHRAVPTSIAILRFYCRDASLQDQLLAKPLKSARIRTGIASPSCLGRLLGGRRRSGCGRDHGPLGLRCQTRRIDPPQFLSHRRNGASNLLFAMARRDEEPQPRGMLLNGRIQDWLDVDSPIKQSS